MKVGLVALALQRRQYHSGDIDISSTQHKQCKKQTQTQTAEQVKCHACKAFKTIAFHVYCAYRNMRA